MLLETAAAATLLPLPLYSYSTLAAATYLLYFAAATYLTRLTSLPLLRCRYFSSRMLSLDLSD